MSAGALTIVRFSNRNVLYGLYSGIVDFAWNPLFLTRREACEALILKFTDPAASPIGKKPAPVCICGQQAEKAMILTLQNLPEYWPVEACQTCRVITRHQSRPDTRATGCLPAWGIGYWGQDERLRHEKDDDNCAACYLTDKHCSCGGVIHTEHVEIVTLEGTPALPGVYVAKQCDGVDHNHEKDKEIP